MSLKLVLGSLAVSGVVIVGGGAALLAAVPEPEPGPEAAQVIRVIDGDTFDARYDGKEHRIRLLNVDTPETKDPFALVECLGPEATSYLKNKLLPGDRVRLEFDVELLDRYGRELAGVYHDGRLVNADIARAGLGVPVVFEPNQKFYPPVAAAFEEAKSAGKGFFDPAQACTLPARIDAHEERTADAIAEAQADPKGAEAELTQVKAEGEELLALIAAQEPGGLAAAGLGESELEKSIDRVKSAQGKLKAAEVQAKKTVEREAKKKAAAKKRAEAAKKAEAQKKAEAKRKRAEEKAAKAQAEEEARRAAAQAEAERQAAAEQSRRAAPVPEPTADPIPAPAPQPAPAPAPQPAPAPAPKPAPAPAPAPANPGLTYTGCRAYVGGPYVDDKGRRYTPIDCETRQPLVP